MKLFIKLMLLGILFLSVVTMMDGVFALGVDIPIDTTVTLESLNASGEYMLRNGSNSESFIDFVGVIIEFYRWFVDSPSSAYGAQYTDPELELGYLNIGTAGSPAYIPWLINGKSSGDELGLGRYVIISDRGGGTGSSKLLWLPYHTSLLGTLKYFLIEYDPVNNKTVLTHKGDGPLEVDAENGVDFLNDIRAPNICYSNGTNCTGSGSMFPLDFGGSYAYNIDELIFNSSETVATGSTPDNIEYSINLENEANNIGEYSTFTILETSDTSPYNDLIFYMNFDDNTSTTTYYDFSGEGHTGTDEGDGYVTDGVIGKGYRFNEVTNGDDIYTIEDSLDIGQNWTIMLWYKINKSSIGSQIITFCIDDGGDEHCLGYYQSGTSRFPCSWDGDGGGLAIRTLWSNDYGHDNEWHHIALAHDGNKGMLYLDGINRVNQSYTNNNLETISFTLNGFNDGSRWSNYTGDEYMAFSRNLSASEILDIYNNQSARFKSNGNKTYNNIFINNSDSVNITIAECQTLKGSVIGMSAEGQPIQNLTNCELNDYSLGSLTDYINLTLYWYSGDYNFYSPIAIGNFNLSWDVQGGTTTYYYNETINYTIAENLNDGITANKTIGTCWLGIEGGIITTTNCSDS